MVEQQCNPKEVEGRATVGAVIASGDDELSNWLKMSDWLERYGGEFFDNSGALIWFVKHHKIELVEMGALIPRFGRNGSLAHRVNLQRAVVTILTREARERLTSA